MRKLAMVATFALLLVAISAFAAFAAPRVYLPNDLTLGLDYNAFTLYGTSYPAWTVSGSYPLDRSWGLVGSYTQAENSVGAERHVTTLGVQHPLTEHVAVRLGVGMEKSINAYGDTTYSDSGLALGLVLTTMMGKEARGYATLGVLAMGGDTETDYSLGMAFPLSSTAEVNLGYKAVGDMGGIGAGLSMQF